MKPNPAAAFSCDRSSGCRSRPATQHQQAAVAGSAAMPSASSGGGGPALQEPGDAVVWCESEELLASMFVLRHRGCSALQSQSHIAGFCAILRRFAEHLVRAWAGGAGCMR